MENARPELDGILVVMIGDFNPQIFQPAWFAMNELVRRAEADAAQVDVIHADVTEFTLGGFRLTITRDRFQAITTDPSLFEPLRDLVVSTFRLLRHTPVRQLGINRNLHFRVPDEERWHALGHRLAPKELWTPILTKPGLQTLTMGGPRPDKHEGRVTVRVEPSTKCRPGVFILINDHFAFSPEEATAADAAMSILHTEFSNSLARTEPIFKAIMGSV